MKETLRDYKQLVRRMNSLGNVIEALEEKKYTFKYGCDIHPYRARIKREARNIRQELVEYEKYIYSLEWESD